MMGTTVAVLGLGCETVRVAQGQGYGTESAFTVSVARRPKYGGAQQT